MANSKMPHDTDVEVGRKIKIRRRTIGMSQETLGKGLGITFQQVQKYEKGTNRVGASRLMKIAEILAVPVSYFFLDENSERRPASISFRDDEITQFLATAEGQALNRAFASIEAKTVKRSVVALVNSLAGWTEEPAGVR